MSRDRDSILEQALKHELRATKSPDAAPALRSFSEGGCLDAEMLAAWSDGALDAAQTTIAEAHVSTCARCQSLVGTLARGTTAHHALEAPEARQAHWRWWLAPLAAGAAAVTLWMVVPEQQELATAPPPAKLEEAVPSSPRAAAPETPPPPAQTLDAPQRRPEARDALAARSRADRQQLGDEKKENVARAQDSAAAAGAPMEAAREAAAPAAPAASPAAPSVAALQRGARLAFAPVVIVSSDPQRRWRASSPGIEQSEDGGATWTLARPSDGEAIVAGASPSPAVCWLVGQAGVVLITIDGTNFTRADVPERDDLVFVTATDAQNATVTTAGGRTFRTDDGGRSWRPN